MTATTSTAGRLASRPANNVRMRVHQRTTGMSSKTTSSSAAPGLDGDWLGVTWWHRPANESQSAGYVVCSGAPMPLIYVTRHVKETLQGMPVSSRW